MKNDPTTESKPSTGTVPKVTISPGTGKTTTSNPSTFPAVTFQNQLNIPVVVYDSFNNNDQANNLANYFGTLTQVGTVAAQGTTTIQPIHGPISVYIVYDTNNNPITRVSTMGDGPQTFQITQADVDIITATNTFVAFLENSPNDPAAVSFFKLVNNGQPQTTAINSYFQSSASYTSCTFISYMLVMTTLARTPASQSQPIPQMTYSLSKLLGYMGVSWPSALPDIVVSNFSCTTNNGTITLSCDVDLNNVTFEEGALGNILGMLPGSTFTTTITLSVTSIQLEFDLASITIPAGNKKTIQIESPVITLSINPAFKFVVFKVTTTIPFTLFNSPTINADVLMTIDNVEAEVSITLAETNATLFTPPLMKGVHFDSVGVGMGVFFDPPGFALGLQGEFHVGDQANVITLDDNTFAVVCDLEGDVPNPLYISFYVPKLTLAQLITTFTNSTVNIDVPVNLFDLSFTWLENVMEPIALPDGTLAAMEFGCSGFVNIFGLQFFGNVGIDMNNGVQATLAMSPWTLGPLSLTGKGQGVTIKVDSQGNPIQNNTIPANAVAAKAIAAATTKQLVKPGGAEMQITTSASPYFTLSSDLTFLGLTVESIDATVSSSGISFELDFGAILSGKLQCNVIDYQNFSGSFSFGPNLTITLPTIAGISLGTLPLTCLLDTNLTIAPATSASGSELDFSASASFDLEGLTLNTGTISLDINLTSMKAVISAISQWITSNVEAIFKDIITDVTKWANWVYNNVIQPTEAGVEYVLNVFKTVFNQTIQEIGPLLQGTAYALQDVAKALKNVFSAAASDVASVLVSAYNAAQNEVAIALQAAEYAVDDITNALVNVFNATENEVASVLHSLGYAAQDVASAIQSFFTTILPDELNDVLQQAGYDVDEIENAFINLGGDLASFASAAWQDVEQYINPSNW